VNTQTTDDASHSPSPPAAPPSGAWRGVPTVVVLIVVLQVLAGGYLLIWMLKELPDAIKLLGNDVVGAWLGLVVLMLVLVVGAMGAGLLYLANRLWQADRVARGITYVACLSIAASILLGADHSAGITLAAIGCIAAVVALAFVSEAQAFFTGPGAPGGDRPSGVVVAQTLIATWLFIVAVVGLLYLMVGFAGVGAKYVVVGLLLLAIAARARNVNARLSGGDSRARNIATIGMGIVVLLIILGGNTTGTGLYLPLGWSVGAAAYLWLPKESQTFFAPNGPAVAQAEGSAP
jgi:hypothetical protein